jgi:ElaB/YqjD/DUF883 family membrane-anchored ribosome-binding protein
MKRSPITTEATMEIHTNGHERGHAKSSSRSLHKARKRTGAIAHQARTQVRHFVQQGEARMSEAVSGATSFIRRRPRTAIAIAFGAGIAIGAIANGKFARAAFVGLIGLVADRFA